MARIVIRPARPDEWPIWRELRLRALTESPDAFGETLASVQGKDWAALTAARPDDVALLACRDEVPVGICAVHTKPLVAKLFSMWVAPEVRGERIGDQLLTHAIAVARIRGVAQVKLNVSDSQSAARKLYLRLGFVPTGDRERLRDDTDVIKETLALGVPPLVMGVVNVTPNSFTDGYPDAEAAIAHGLELVRAGADILDIGGEATNPKAQPVTADEELRRILPVVEALARDGRVPISVDTYKARVAREAVERGAAIVNDISGMQYDEELAAAVAGTGAAVVLMHNRGRSKHMYREAVYEHVIEEIRFELEEAIARATSAGVQRESIIIDPGIGFAKRAEHSYRALARLEDLRALDRPILSGPSRKSFLSQGMARTRPAERDWGTAAAVAASVLFGAHIVRVHAVAEMADVVRVADRIRAARA
jgi:dihydropteroate synthase